MQIYNTPEKKIVPFFPLCEREVKLYTCGPTVYERAHIGNLRTYLFEDILKRALKNEGYIIRHVMNITDVGHLTDDGDEGDDKLQLSAMQKKKNAWDIAREYETQFKEDIASLGIIPPDYWTRATEYISQQIDMVKKLEAKGLLYQLKDGLYFDTSQFGDYGKFACLQLDEQWSTGREGGNGQKKHPADFAVWKFSPQGVHRDMEWNSPWGKGFPGWHLECSAMIEAVLGSPIDIHCGGIDHVTVHHTNEIAQTWGACGRDLARYWMHGEFLMVDGKKMSKSLGNTYTLEDLKNEGFEPQDFRYWVLQGHYRQKLNFTWEALRAAQNRRLRLKKEFGLFDDVNEYRKINSEVLHHKDFGSFLEKNFVVTHNEKTLILKITNLFTSYLLEDLSTAKILGSLAELRNTILQETKEKKLLGLIGIWIDMYLGLDISLKSKKDISLQVLEESKINETLFRQYFDALGYDSELSDKIGSILKQRGYTILNIGDSYQIIQPSGQKYIQPKREVVDKLVKERIEAKKKKNFKKADDIKLQLLNIGYTQIRDISQNETELFTDSYSRKVTF